MLQKILISVLLITISFSCYAQSESIPYEYGLSFEDSFEHSPKEFLLAIREIQYYKPNYSREEIAEMVMLTYRYVHKQGRRVSVYEVAQGIKRFSKDKLGIDLKTLAMAYAFSQSNIK